MEIRVKLTVNIATIEKIFKRFWKNTKCLKNTIYNPYFLKASLDRGCTDLKKSIKRQIYQPVLI